VALGVSGTGCLYDASASVAGARDWRVLPAINFHRSVHGRGAVNTAAERAHHFGLCYRGHADGHGRLVAPDGTTRAPARADRTRPSSFARRASRTCARAERPNGRASLPFPSARGIASYASAFPGHPSSARALRQMSMRKPVGGLATVPMTDTLPQLWRLESPSTSQGSG
jgi:hypothetical protein